MTRITQQQLESYLWGAAVLLRGTIDAGDYKQFIFPLLFFKRLCDVFDEETLTALRDSGGDRDFALFPENHRFQIPADAHWREIRKVTRDVGRTLQQATRAIEVANQDKLMGIFCDAQWTNKDRLSDAMLRDLIEHFSTLELTVADLPEDELGQGYEYLIKKFADDSGHTAAEFYHNPTVVHLMTEMLDVEPGESVYDPTCGSGGMLLSCITHLRRAGKEWRNVKLYGQERNLMTSSIARMNCFLHGIEDFRIERGDTLAEPKFVEGDRLQRFDVVLANPPYSIKQWNREAFVADPWGRNMFGVPPQGRADYAFQQHILKSLKPKSGRCAVLWPHGVLFRQEEAEMRRKLIEADLIECVIGLGPNLFYNSPMEACVVVCRTQKSKARRGKILFINAINEVTREHAQSFLTDEHLLRVVRAYQDFTNEPGFTRVATLEEIRSKDDNLSIPLYVEAETNAQRDKAVDAATTALPAALSGWIDSSHDFRSSLNALNDLATRPIITTANSLTANLDWASLPLFDRARWTRERFGDVVENRNETCDPVEVGMERFVAMEHMEPGSLHLRSWGNVADGMTFTRRCSPGQVLFGKRRAYQRKVAVAEFEAVVSGDIYVLAPKDPQRLLPELLPFLCLSERFFQHAVGTSAGSLSPRTNWSSLASFEFALPPLDQQRRIAELLWAVDASGETAFGSLASLTSLKQIEMQERTFGSPDIGNHGHMCRLDSLATFQYGLSCALGESGEYPILRMMNYDDELVAANDLKYADMPDALASNYVVQEGDLLFNRTNSADLVGKVGIFKLAGKYLFASYLVRIVADRSKLLPEFLNYCLNSEKGQAAVRAFATPGVSQANISAGSLKKVFVPVPPLGQQKNVIAELDRICAAHRAGRAHLVRLKKMFQSLINAIFASTP